MRAKDKLGQPLNVGDPVVFMQLNYRNLLVGDVKSISAKMLVITHEKTNVGSTETRQYHSQVVNLLR